MEPQPGSPTSPPFSPGTAVCDNNARAAAAASAEATPSDETAAKDEPKEDITEEREPGRKSTSSSSSSSARSLCRIDVLDLGDDQLLAAPPEDDEHGAEIKPVDSATPEDERDAETRPVGSATTTEDAQAAPAHRAEVEPEDERAAPAVQCAAEVKPDDWAAWPGPPPPSADDSFASSDGGTAPTEAPQAPAAAPGIEGAAEAAGAGGNESLFDPQRIPASVFQPRTSVSQADWSMTSNESLFSIQGASDVGGLCASRSHFDFFYDEAMAAAAEADSKLPSLAEGAESREFAAPGSANSAASAGKATVFRRHDSGSGGSSSNFSFAFPILAEMSPKKKDLVSSALYQPLKKESEQPPPLPPPQLEPPVSAFMEMTTEEERRRSDTGCCCCGCCWFDCSWCCRCHWWSCGCCCPCACACPSFCRCSWCLCS